MGAYDWLVLFSKALEMGCEAGKELEEKPEIQSLADALNKIKGVMGQDLKIFLDIKSRGVPGEVWAAMVEQIHTYPSIQIQGCGSFVIEEVRFYTFIRKALTTPTHTHTHTNIQIA